MDLPQVADVLSIHRVIHDYAAANDDRDIEAILECFGAEGSFGLQVAGQDAVGPFTRTALSDFMSSTLGAQSDQRRHVVTNIRVSRLDDQRCRASSYFTLLVTDQGVTRTLTAGVYTDILVRAPGGRWVFAEKWLDLDGQP